MEQTALLSESELAASRAWLVRFCMRLSGNPDLALFNYPRFFDGVWIGVVIIAIVGVPAVANTAGLTTMLQQSVEDAYRGRVFGVMGTLGSSLQLVGTLLAGLLGGVLGPLTLLNIQGGAYMLVGSLALLLLPRAMERDANAGVAARVDIERPMGELVDQLGR